MDNINLHEIVHLKKDGSISRDMEFEDPVEYDDGKLHAMCTYCHDLLSPEEVETKQFKNTTEAGRDYVRVFHVKCWEDGIRDCPNCSHHTLVRRKNVEYCISRDRKKTCNYWKELGGWTWRTWFQQTLDSAFTMVTGSYSDIHVNYQLYGDDFPIDSKEPEEMKQMVLQRFANCPFPQRNNIYLVSEAYHTSDNKLRWLWSVIYIPSRLQQVPCYAKLISRLNWNEPQLCVYPSRQEYEAGHATFLSTTQ